jgi:hypothetical protein
MQYASLTPAVSLPSASARPIFIEERLVAFAFPSAVSRNHDSTFASKRIRDKLSRLVSHRRPSHATQLCELLIG